MTWLKKEKKRKDKCSIHFKEAFKTYFTVRWPITILKITHKKTITSTEGTQHTQRPPKACFCLYDNLQQYTWPECLPATERMQSTTGDWGRRIQWPRWYWTDDAALASRTVLSQREVQVGMQWVDMILACGWRKVSPTLWIWQRAWYITLIWSTLAPRALARGRKRASMLTNSSQNLEVRFFEVFAQIYGEISKRR